MFRFLCATRHRRNCLLITFGLTTLAVLASLPWSERSVPGSMLHYLEMKSIDARFRQRGPRAAPVEVVIAAIDENAIREEGQWPWRRARMADVIRALDEAKVRAVVLDIAYLEPDVHQGGAESDAKLVQQVRQSGHVFLAWFGSTGSVSPKNIPDRQMQVFVEQAWPVSLDKNGWQELLAYEDVTPPLSELMKAARSLGFAEVRTVGDSIFRFYDLVATYRGKVYPSLALAVAAADLGIAPERIVIRPGVSLSLGDQATIPLIAEGAMLLDFYGPNGTIPHFSVTDILRRRIPPQQLTGRIVVVGATAKGLHEIRPSPFGPDFYGVEIQATAIANLLEKRGLRASRLGTDLLITIVLGVGVGLTLTLWRPGAGALASLVLLLGYNVLCVRLFAVANYLLPMAAPNVALIACMLAVLLYRLSTEERHRSRITETFGLFVPPEVVGELTREEAPLAPLQAERREITVLFADIRNFTSYAERRPPEDVVQLLNRYFSLMHEIVWEYHGTLDKYMGDGLLAFFGAPKYQENHAERAVLAALKMQEQVRRRRDEWRQYGMEHMRVGMGLDSGEVLVGFAGSQGRMQYTAIGNVVNLASRLEEKTREVEADILISAGLARKLEGVVEMRPIGQIPIRGLSAAVEVYAVTGRKDVNSLGAARKAGN
ncbi:MAG: CHASE2 domain-containing protein [Candidatus Zipacnadales bacterium]